MFSDTLDPKCCSSDSVMLVFKLTYPSEEGEFFFSTLFPILNFNLGLEEKFVRVLKTP